MKDMNNDGMRLVTRSVINPDFLKVIRCSDSVKKQLEQQLGAFIEACATRFVLSKNRAYKDYKTDKDLQEEMKFFLIESLWEVYEEKARLTYIAFE